MQLASSPYITTIQSFKANPCACAEDFIRLCLDKVSRTEGLRQSIYDRMSERQQQQRDDHLHACVLRMLENEWLCLHPEPLWPPFYYVFYRLVKEQIVLYELNTQILETMRFIPQRSHQDTIICSPYLREDDFYPSDKNELMEWFMDGGNDMGAGERDERYCLGLLCVNNCLNPRVDERGFNRLLFNREAEANPLLYFVDGYSAGNMTESAMAISLTTAYDITQQEADIIVEKIMALYKGWEVSATETGHCVQILIPNTLEALDEFVHLSPAYGRPVTVYKDRNSGQDFAVETLDPILSREYKRPSERESKKKLQETIEAADLVSMREVLACRDMAFLQARIIGHPHLFLKYGAHAKVFSADPSFNLRHSIGESIGRILSSLYNKRKHLIFHKML